MLTDFLLMNIINRNSCIYFIYFSYYIFVQDNKSAYDLAKEGNNPDILEVVKIQTSSSSSSRDDPFVQLLSNYMSTKSFNPRLSVVPAQVYIHILAIV